METGLLCVPPSANVSRQVSNSFLVSEGSMRIGNRLIQLEMKSVLRSEFYIK